MESSKSCLNINGKEIYCSISKKGVNQKIIKRDI